MLSLSKHPFELAGPPFRLSLSKPRSDRRGLRQAQPERRQGHV